jgi:hypothetical protein
MVAEECPADAYAPWYRQTTLLLRRFTVAVLVGTPLNVSVQVVGASLMPSRRLAGQSPSSPRARAAFSICWPSTTTAACGDRSKGQRGHSFAPPGPGFLDARPGTDEYNGCGYFPGILLRSDPPRLLWVALALGFHPANETVLRYFSSEIPVERIGVGIQWRQELRVMFRAPASLQPWPSQSFARFDKRS